MATMQEIVNAITTELRFGSGTDVQIHLQDGIVQRVSRLYRSLMKKYVWRDYYSTGLYTTDADGKVVADISGVLTKYSNIIGVYLENDSSPLPFAPVSQNLSMLKRPALVRISGAKVFQIYPNKVYENITLVTREYTEADFGIDDKVPFYKDLLVLGGAWNLATKAGINQQLTRELQAEFQETLAMYVMDELQNSYQLNQHRGVYPTEWYVDDRS